MQLTVATIFQYVLYSFRYNLLWSIVGEYYSSCSSFVHSSLESINNTSYSNNKSQLFNNFTNTNQRLIRQRYIYNFFYFILLIIFCIHYLVPVWVEKVLQVNRTHFPWVFLLLCSPLSQVPTQQTFVKYAVSVVIRYFRTLGFQNPWNNYI